MTLSLIHCCYKSRVNSPRAPGAPSRPLNPGSPTLPLIPLGPLRPTSPGGPGCPGIPPGPGSPRSPFSQGLPERHENQKYTVCSFRNKWDHSTVIMIYCVEQRIYILISFINISASHISKTLYYSLKYKK